MSGSLEDFLHPVWERFGQENRVAVLKEGNLPVGICQVVVIEHQYPRQRANTFLQILKCSGESRREFVRRHVVTSLSHAHRDPVC